MQPFSCDIVNVCAMQLKDAQSANNSMIVFFMCYIVSWLDMDLSDNKRFFQYFCYTPCIILAAFQSEYDLFTYKCDGVATVP